MGRAVSNAYLLKAIASRSSRRSSFHQLLSSPTKSSVSCYRSLSLHAIGSTQSSDLVLTSFVPLQAASLCITDLLRNHHGRCECVLCPHTSYFLADFNFEIGERSLANSRTQVTLMQNFHSSRSAVLESVETTTEGQLGLSVS